MGKAFDRIYELSKNSDATSSAASPIPLEDFQTKKQQTAN